MLFFAPAHFFVIPAQAGIHVLQSHCHPGHNTKNVLLF